MIGNAEVIQAVEWLNNRRTPAVPAASFKIRTVADSAHLPLSFPIVCRSLLDPMKLTLRPECDPRSLGSFIGFIDIKTGAKIVVLFAIINKVAGVYGLIAVLTGAGGSLAQLSMYIYSIGALGAFAWCFQGISEVRRPKHQKRASPCLPQVLVCITIICRKTPGRLLSPLTTLLRITSSILCGLSFSPSIGGFTIRMMGAIPHSPQRNRALPT